MVDLGRKNNDPSVSLPGCFQELDVGQVRLAAGFHLCGEGLPPEQFGSSA